MAGHSKWANIQHRKGAQDKKRGRLFTKLIREVTVAARSGGDPDANSRLRLAIDRALAANMPKDTIERAIQRGTGELGGKRLEEARYEGYGPGGIAILVECTTDNRTRTVGEIRHAFSKAGGNLGADGSVAFLFKRQGVLAYQTSGDATAAERLLEAALDSGAEDVTTVGDWTEVVTTPEQYAAVRAAMAASGHDPYRSELGWWPETSVPIDGGLSETLVQLIERLEDLDDVQAVYTNVDWPDDADAAAA